MNTLSQEKLESVTITLDASIIEAMKAIDRGAAQIAMVVDGAHKLIGVLTDGDLRRAILSEASLETSIAPFVNREFRQVRSDTSRTEALDLMKCFSVEQLPIVNDSGHLCGLHLLNELIQPKELPNTAVVLAGGKGTRLGKLTQNIPKPMLKVAGRPILERILLHLVGGGIRRVFFSVNYLASMIEDYFGSGVDYGCQITYLRETKPLGTGGPLAMLRDYNLDAPTLVMNGDLITDFDVSGIFETHRRARNQITIGVRNYTHEVPFGCIKTKAGQVTEIVEKPSHQETINAGIYVVDQSITASVPMAFTPMTELVDEAIKRSNRVGVFHIDDWIDIGQPKQLNTARGMDQ